MAIAAKPFPPDHGAPWISWSGEWFFHSHKHKHPGHRRLSIFSHDHQHSHAFPEWIGGSNRRDDQHHPADLGHAGDPDHPDHNSPG
jgi:hypothetical protein